MAEGVRTASGSVTESRPSSSGSKREIPPEPEANSELAPRGWRFDKMKWQWVPRLAPGRKVDKQYPATSYPRKGEPAFVMGTPDDAPQGDPDPGWMTDDDSPKKKTRMEDIPKKVLDDIAGTAGLVGIPILSFLQQVDPYCGSALASQYEQIIGACMPLICRSEKIVKYFSGESDLMIWLGLGMALKPVATAVWQHHIARSVEVVRDEHGIAHFRPRTAPGTDDHLTPPVHDEFSYAA